MNAECPCCKKSVVRTFQHQVPNGDDQWTCRPPQLRLHKDGPLTNELVENLAQLIRDWQIDVTDTRTLATVIRDSTLMKFAIEREED